MPYFKMVRMEYLYFVNNTFLVGRYWDFNEKKSSSKIMAGSEHES